MAKQKDQCPYNKELDAAAQIEAERFAKLETEALKEIQKLADNNDPVLDAISKAAREVAR